MHSCILKEFTKAIDNFDGWEIQHCHGIDPMILEIVTRGQDGCENFCSETLELTVNYCPFCGLASCPERSKREDSQQCEMRCSELQRKPGEAS